MGRFNLAAGIAAVLAVASVAHAQSPAFTQAQRAEGEAKIREAAAYLAKTMRDPSSASFRSVFIEKRVTEDGREPITICGEVNGRNGYGGFTGFQAFIAFGDRVDVGTALGLDVAQLCRGRNPIVDTRDYTPEMREAYAAALRG
jgi:hypothetical protein